MSELNVVQKAAKEINEKDSEGAVAQIKVSMKLVMANNTEITKLQKSNDDLIKGINKLAATAPLSASDFLTAE